jgi:hypothetical protein
MERSHPLATEDTFFSSAYGTVFREDRRLVTKESQQILNCLNQIKYLWQPWCNKTRNQYKKNYQDTSKSNSQWIKEDIKKEIKNSIFPGGRECKKIGYSKTVLIGKFIAINTQISGG